jgi:hypothetical protein
MKNQDIEPYASFEREYRRRQIIADDANEAVNGARDAYPTLSADSTRETLIAWLCCDDRNGCYSDADMMAEYGEIMTLDEAWAQVDLGLDDFRAWRGDE